MYASHSLMEVTEQATSMATTASLAEGYGAVGTFYAWLETLKGTHAGGLILIDAHCDAKQNDLNTGLRFVKYKQAHQSQGQRICNTLCKQGK